MINFRTKIIGIAAVGLLVGIGQPQLVQADDNLSICEQFREAKEKFETSPGTAELRKKMGGDLKIRVVCNLKRVEFELDTYKKPAQLPDDFVRRLHGGWNKIFCGYLKGVIDRGWQVVGLFTLGDGTRHRVAAFCERRFG